jgi:hypothetical protein
VSHTGKGCVPGGMVNTALYHWQMITAESCMQAMAAGKAVLGGAAASVPCQGA